MTAMERLQQMQSWMGEAQAPVAVASVPAPASETRLDRIRRWSRELQGALELLETLPGLLEQELERIEAHQESLSGGAWRHAREEAGLAIQGFEAAGLACRHLGAALADGEPGHCQAAVELADESEDLLDEVERRMTDARREQPLVA